MKETNKKRIRVRVRVREIMKTLEERKTKNKNLSEICIWRRCKNEKMKKNIKIHEKLKRGISQE